MSPPEQRSFRFLGERIQYDAGFYQLKTATFLDPDGFTFERDIVRHPGAVCVVAIEGDPPHVLLVRQYRGAVNDEMLEVPAGKLDIPGEPLETAAARELAEEVGRTAADLAELGSFLNSPGFTDERTTCFLARGLATVDRDAHGIEEEHMVVVAVPWSEIWNRIGRGEIVDAKTIIALALAARHLARG